MVDQEPGKFKLGLDKTVEEIEPSYIEEDSKKYKRSRVAIYILLVLILVAIATVYLDLYRRVTQSQYIGTNQLDSLEGRLITLSDNFTVLEGHFNQNNTANQKGLEGLGEQLGKVEKAVKEVQKKVTAYTTQAEMKSVTATPKKDIQQIDSQASESLKQLQSFKSQLANVEALNKNLEQLKVDLTGTTEKLNDAIEEIHLQLDNSSKNLIELQSKVSRLAKNQLDQKTVDSLIRKRLKDAQPAAKQVTKTLSDHRARIDALKKQTADLKQDADVYINEILKIKKQLKVILSGKSNQSSKLKSAPQINIPTTTASEKSGQLLQQTLKE